MLCCSAIAFVYLLQMLWYKVINHTVKVRTQQQQKQAWYIQEVKNKER